MVQFLSINFFLGFLQFLLGFSKVPVFMCHPVHEGNSLQWRSGCELTFQVPHRSLQSPEGETKIIIACASLQGLLSSFSVTPLSVQTPCCQFRTV